MILYVRNNEFYICIKQFSVCACYNDGLFIDINTFHRCGSQKGCTDCEHTGATTKIAYNFSFNVSLHECMVR